MLMSQTLNEKNMYNPARLAALIKEKAIEFGDFTLASGATASYYLDLRRLTLDGEGANLIAAGFLDLLAPEMPTAVGGMAIGADPITASIITLAYQRGLELRGFIVRKEPKGHGKGQQVEGPVSAGDRVVIVEDVVTSGGSSIRAIEAARAHGLQVDRVLAIVDRGSQTATVFADAGVKFEALFHVSDLIG